VARKIPLRKLGARCEGRTRGRMSEKTEGGSNQLSSTDGAGGRRGILGHHRCQVQQPWTWVLLHAVTPVGRFGPLAIGRTDSDLGEASGRTVDRGRRITVPDPTRPFGQENGRGSAARVRLHTSSMIRQASFPTLSAVPFAFLRYPVLVLQTE